MNMDYKDPFGLLPWLYDVLLSAESKGEKVRIQLIDVEVNSVK